MLVLYIETIKSESFLSKILKVNSKPKTSMSSNIILENWLLIIIKYVFNANMLVENFTKTLIINNFRQYQSLLELSN